MNLDITYIVKNNLRYATNAVLEPLTCETLDALSFINLHVL